MVGFNLDEFGSLMVNSSDTFKQMGDMNWLH